MGFYVDHASWKDNIHANALASLTATLALPYKIEQEILIASWSLCYHKQALESNKYIKQGSKSKIVCETSSDMELRDWRFPFIDVVRYGILLEDQKKKSPPLKEGQINSSTTPPLNSYTEGHMMELCSGVYPAKKHKLHYKKSIMICVVLTNPDPNSGIGYEKCATFCQKW